MVNVHAKLQVYCVEQKKNNPQINANLRWINLFNCCVGDAGYKMADNMMQTALTSTNLTRQCLQSVWYHFTVAELVARC